MRTGLMAFFFGKYSGFIGQAYYALRTIESGSNGSKLISSLVNSSENSWIKETEGGSKYNSGSNTTLWNPNEDYRTMDNFDRISSISMTYGLAHELGHNYNDVIGGGWIRAYIHQFQAQTPCSMMNSEPVDGRI
ncbi:MAG TPA: hypothetical protein VHO43_17230 [Ignavibacteriales bacterium]|nr:hypothetical protein [Ignavibacteriales bacterium]